MTPMRLVRLLLLSALLLTAARAQTVQWQTADSGDTSDLQLVFQDCAPEGDPRVPALTDATLSFGGSSQQTSIVNFNISRSVVLTYRLRARTAGSVQIPAFTVKTTAGDLRVPAFTTGAVRQAADVNVHARLLPGATTVWAGEVFPLSYTLDVARRTFNQLGSAVEWNSAPLIVEDWSKPEPAEFTTNGEARLNIVYKTRAYAKSPGSLALNAAGQLLNVTTGTVGFGLFQQQRVEQISVTSNQPSITVRPLPLPAPAGFSGAVGQLRLTSKVVPETAAVGEPITWTLELSGTGNWPDLPGLPARTVSRDFQVIQPQAKRTPAEGKLFDVILAEDVVLVPAKPGTYTLGPIEFAYFDVKSGTYRTLTTPRSTVTVTVANAPRFNVTPPADANLPAATAQPPEPPAPPPLPAAIPRDPLPGSETVNVPFARLRTLGLTALAPFAALAAFWLVLTTRRARKTDPTRPRREARARLTALLAQMRADASGLSSPAHRLLQWQRDAAVLWQIDHAAPPASALGDATWARLWQEADRTLYSNGAALPADWPARASSALAAKKAPGFGVWRIFLPRNLLPFLALALALTLTPGLSAADPAAAYRQGDFATAGKVWQQAVVQKPADWIARHNLALALAQQDRWPEAAAHATAAFVQNPVSEASRWNLALVYEKAGYTPTALAPFLHPGLRQLLARMASPAVWELILVGASVLVALALGWLLWTAYHHRPRWTKALAGTMLVLGVLLAAAAFTGRATYGPAACPQAALVWRGTTLHSIPTEAETNQKTTALPAGSLGVIDRSFLGWVRLAFDNGQTGWVRQGELVLLWK